MQLRSLLNLNSVPVLVRGCGDDYIRLLRLTSSVFGLYLCFDLMDFLLQVFVFSLVLHDPVNKLTFKFRIKPFHKLLDKHLILIVGLYVRRRWRRYLALAWVDTVLGRVAVDGRTIGGCIALSQLFVETSQSGRCKSLLIVRGIISDVFIGVQRRRDVLESSGPGTILSYRLEEQQRLVWCVGCRRRHPIVGTICSLCALEQGVAVAYGGPNCSCKFRRRIRAVNVVVEDAL